MSFPSYNHENITARTAAERQFAQLQRLDSTQEYALRDINDERLAYDRKRSGAYRDRIRRQTYCRKCTGITKLLVIRYRSSSKVFFSPFLKHQAESSELKQIARSSDRVIITRLQAVLTIRCLLEYPHQRLVLLKARTANLQMLLDKRQDAAGILPPCDSFGIHINNAVDIAAVNLFRLCSGDHVQQFF